MFLAKKDSAVKINKIVNFDSIVIENNLDRKYDKLGKVFNRIFLANGIENVKYKKFSGVNSDEKRLILSINHNMFKENEEKLNNIVHSVNKIIDKCDIENELIEVRISSERLSAVGLPLNIIEFSNELMEKYDIGENQNINLIDVKNATIKICCVKYNEKLKGNFIALNLSDRKNFSESSNIYIQKKSNIKFNKISVQSVDDILEGYITIPESYKSWGEKHGGKEFELMNEITGASMDISFDKIKYDNKIGESSIKLNYFQRLVLEGDLPQKIPKYHYEKFKTMLAEDDDKLAVLTNHYENGKALTVEVLKTHKDSYNHKKVVKEVLGKAGYPVLGLYPISREEKAKENFICRVIDKILDITIGSNKIYLKCIRPYETDESSNVVRLAKGTLELLGVDETDNLIISYRNKKVKARALMINEIESIKETNIFQTESELNACIGIPAHIRKKLGINKINVCCNVERDKRYLFEKNLNIQFISIIATVLAVKQNFNYNNKIVAILLLICIPFSIYLIFSTVRNRISNK